MVSKAEREAWAFAYRIYEKYAELMRSAAQNDDDASGLFSDAVSQMEEKWVLCTDKERLILLTGYKLLDDVYRQAKG